MPLLRLSWGAGQHFMVGLCFCPASRLFAWIGCGLVPPGPHGGEPRQNNQRECTNSHPAWGLCGARGQFLWQLHVAGPQHFLLCVVAPAQQTAPAWRPPELRGDPGRGAEHTTPTVGAVNSVNPAFGYKGPEGRARWPLGVWAQLPPRQVPHRLHTALGVITAERPAEVPFSLIQLMWPH